LFDVTALSVMLQDMSRLKSDVEGRLRLAETQINELASSVRQKDTELQVGTEYHSGSNEIVFWLFIFNPTLFFCHR